MSNVHTFLPKLTLNELFIRDFMAADAPCFAMGYVEERKSISGFLALRPEQPIPKSVTQQGFNFGHSVVGTEDNPVLHFAFEFYGHAVYHALVNPGNAIVCAVLATMLDIPKVILVHIKTNTLKIFMMGNIYHNDLQVKQ